MIELGCTIPVSPVGSLRFLGVRTLRVRFLRVRTRRVHFGVPIEGDGVDERLIVGLMLGCGYGGRLAVRLGRELRSPYVGIQV